MEIHSHCVLNPIKININTLFQKIGLFENWVWGKSITVSCFIPEHFTHLVTSLFPMKGRQIRLLLRDHGPWTWRDLYRATLAMTRDLGFHGLIKRTSRLITSYSKLDKLRNYIFLTQFHAKRNWIEFKQYQMN